LSCIKNEFLFATNFLSPHYYETLKSTVTFKSRKRHKHREAFFKFFYSAAILKRRKGKRFRDILFNSQQLCRIQIFCLAVSFFRFTELRLQTGNSPYFLCERIVQHQIRQLLKIKIMRAHQIEITVNNNQFGYAKSKRQIILWLHNMMPMILQERKRCISFLS
jgi:hypothetical protein